MATTADLLEKNLFSPSCDRLDDESRVRISYLRAREMARRFNLQLRDVLELTPKFWSFHQNDICAFDIAAFSLVTIQYNLAAGTIASHTAGDQTYRSVLDRILNFEVSAQYMLTELGHGLDAKNLETTATFLPDGGFDLHTPSRSAAKYMPPTSPIRGFPRIAVVFAKLLVNGEDVGVRPFLVWLNDGHKMTPGITCKVLPRRTGSKPLDHSITTFEHVRLPASALLGSLEKPADSRQHFLDIISRINVGTMAITTTLLPIMKRCIYTAGMYSLRRHVSNNDGQPMPIVEFRTQHAPILHALAQLAVFQAWVPDCIRQYTDPSANATAKHSLAAILKAVLTKATQTNLFILAERCGAQGLYEYNNIIESQLESRGISISEGDTLALSIRLASELLLGRYQVPPAQTSSLLTLHERALFDEGHRTLQAMKSDHRSNEFNENILLRCQPLVEAIGHRMAYEAAVKAGVPDKMLRLFEIGIILQDSAWYVEAGKLSRKEQFDREALALNDLLPDLASHLDQLNVEPFCKAPILSEEAMQAYLEQLDMFDEHGRVSAGKSRVGMAML